MIILENLYTEFGNIKIIQSKGDGTCTYYQDECFHSQVRADGISTCAYVHVMYSIIRQAEARRVLMIGCAGGTLATMLHRLGCEVTVVDINPHAFTLAKRYFQMPEEVTCLVEDGLTHLLTSKKRYDAVAIDAFDSDGTVPEQFTSEEFFPHLRDALGHSGVVVMNVMVAHDMDMLADRIGLHMEAAGLPTALFDWPGRADRNTIIAGGAISRTQIFSYTKPAWLRQTMRGIVRRPPKKRALGV